MLRFTFRQLSPDKKAKLGCDGECGTECFIEELDGHAVAYGAARLSPGDNFSRPVGRKISAGRAIRSAVPHLGSWGAAERRALWEQLFKQSPSTRGAKRV